MHIMSSLSFSPFSLPPHYDSVNSLPCLPGTHKKTKADLRMREREGMDIKKREKEK